MLSDRSPSPPAQRWHWPVRGLHVREAGLRELRQKSLRASGKPRCVSDSSSAFSPEPGVRLKGKLVTEAKGLRVVVPDAEKSPKGQVTGLDRPEPSSEFACAP